MKLSLLTLQGRVAENPLTNPHHPFPDYLVMPGAYPNGLVTFNEQNHGLSRLKLPSILSTFSVVMAPRSSARLRAKRGDNDSNLQAEEPLVELPQSFVEGSSDHSGPRRKKQNTGAPGRKTKKPAPRVKGKRGALQLIVEMPLELFYEVLKLLDPGDLLSLSRANPFLRSLVLDRQAALSLWKDVGYVNSLA